MSIRTNTWDLDSHYDLTKSGENPYRDSGAPISAKMYSMGNNNYGQLGLNDKVRRSSPTQIPGTTWRSVSGNYHSAVTGVKSDGTLWAWGYNQSGALAQNNTIDYSSPVQIPGTQWHLTHGNMYGMMGTKSDGTLWVWGNNNEGTLGLNNLVTYSSPIQLPGTQWDPDHITGNRQGMAALKTDGTLWVWGGSTQGEAGQNAAVQRSSPTQIPGTQWTSVSFAYRHLRATKSDGSLWSWGNNSYGKLSVNDLTFRSSPVQVPGTQWTSTPRSQSYQGWAFKSQELWYLGGYNTQGRNGLNDVIARSSPVQVPGTQWGSSYEDSTPFSASYRGIHALKTDGTLWTWGHNATYGLLGLNDVIPRSSPHQIPGTQWISTGVGGYSDGYHFIFQEN